MMKKLRTKCEKVSKNDHQVPRREKLLKDLHNYQQVIKNKKIFQSLYLQAKIEKYTYQQC